jgi:hypothetical protein
MEAIKEQNMPLAKPTHGSQKATTLPTSTTLASFSDSIRRAARSLRHDGEEIVMEAWNACEASESNGIFAGAGGVAQSCHCYRI